jgi:hypothetical protein
MRIAKLRNTVIDTTGFTKLKNYIDFCHNYLEFIDTAGNMQAKIVAQNEHQYFFFQYKKDGNYQITRPINSDLFLNLNDFEKNLTTFKNILAHCTDFTPSANDRLCVNNMIYTMQQCLGSTLDALPIGQSNKARKINGSLFEKLIVLFLNEMQITAKAETLRIPIVHNNQVLFKMKYQHDLVIHNDLGDVKVIGAVKTTSKDRIDKVFIDKLLYSKLTSTEIYHIAVILNDVQRKKTKDVTKFSIGSTFLPGRFKGYMIKLCPLDGVYYFDIRKAMQTDKELKNMIQTFDRFVFDDIPKFIKK